MAEGDIRRYQTPTHLKTEDQLTIGWFSFTFRQLTVLVLGGGAAYEVVNQFPRTLLASLLGSSVTLGVQLVLLALLVPLMLALAFGRWNGRTLETWLFVWLRYRSQPQCYCWQRQPERAPTAAQPPALPIEAEEEG